MRSFLKRYWVWLAIGLVMVCVLLLSFVTVSMIRAAVTNDHRWSMLQKSMVNELFHYLVSKDPDHLARFRTQQEEMKQVLAFRRMLMQESTTAGEYERILPQLDKVVMPDRLILFHRIFRYYPRASGMFAAWNESTRLLADQIFSIDAALLLAGRNVPSSDLDALIIEVTHIDARLSRLYENYHRGSEIVIQHVAQVMILFNISFSVLLIGFGILVDAGLNRRRNVLNATLGLVLQEFPLHAFVLGRSFQIVRVQPETSRFPNPKPGETIAFCSLFRDADRENIQSALRSASAAGSSHILDASFAADEDATASVQIFIKPIAETFGDERFVVLVTDLTEARKAGEERLRLLEGLNASLNEIFVFDPENQRVLFMNRGARHNLGYEPEETEKLSFLDINLEVASEELAELKNHPDDSRKIVLQGNHLRKNGTQYPVETHIQYMRLGARPFFLAVAVDITERISTEERLRKAYQEQRILLRETNHRIKNNLNMVASLLTLQLPEIKDPEARTLVQESVNRLNALMLLHDQLFIAHSMDNFDMTDYIRKLISGLTSSFVDRETRFQIEVDPVQMTSFEAIHCGLMVNELVTNSLKHAFTGFQGEKVIRIALRAIAPDLLELSVSDNGRGFPDGFNPESRSSLGMLLLNALTRQMAGSLTAQNRDGAHFTIRFKTGTSTDR